MWWRAACSGDRGRRGLTGALLAAAVLTAACTPSERPTTGAVRHGPVDGFYLQAPAELSVETRGQGWRLFRAGEENRRTPFEIIVHTALTLPAGRGEQLRWGERSLTRFRREEGGGSAGAAVTLTFIEQVGPATIAYEETAYADGLAPVFVLPDLLRTGALQVTSTDSRPAPSDG